MKAPLDHYQPDTILGYDEWVDEETKVKFEKMVASFPQRKFLGNDWTKFRNKNKVL